MRWIGNLLAGTCVAICSLLSTPASIAQTVADGNPRWCTVLPVASGLPPACYSDPLAACYRQWQAFNGAPNSSFFGLLWKTGTSAKCDWSTWLNRCYGNSVQCGLVGPGSVNLTCDAGFYLVVPGRCEKIEELESPLDNCGNAATGSQPNSATPNPISIMTGAKILTATDYSSSDGKFVVSRTYRSFGVGPSRPYVFIALPMGLGGHWKLDDHMELNLSWQLGSGRYIVLNNSDGSSYEFYRNGTTNVFEPVENGSVGRRNSSYRIEFVGTLPPPGSTGALDNLTLATTQWRVIDANDNVWLMQTSKPTGGNRYTMGRPSTVTTRDGYQRTFTRGILGELQGVADIFGRSATFTWNYFNPSSFPNTPPGLPLTPLTIKEATLPDSTKVKYFYDVMNT